MEDTLLNLGVEILFLGFLGLLYYLWQRRRILAHTSDSSLDHAHLIYHMAISCQEPEHYKDLTRFIDWLEPLLHQENPTLTTEMWQQWNESSLPTDVLDKIHQAQEWFKN